MYRAIEDIQAEINECSRERLTQGSRLAALGAERDEQDKIKHSPHSSNKDTSEASERKSQITIEIGEVIKEIQRLEKLDHDLNIERREAEKHEKDLAWRSATVQSLKHELSSIVTQVKSAEGKRRECSAKRVSVVMKVREAKDALNSFQKLKEQANELREDRKKRKAIGIFQSTETKPALDDELLALDIEIESQSHLLTDYPYLIEEGERLKAEITKDLAVLREDVDRLKSKYWQIYKRIALKKYDAAIKPLLSALSEVIACDQSLSSDSGLKMLQGLNKQGLLVMNSEGSFEISEAVTSFDVANTDTRVKLEKEFEELIAEDI